MKFLMFKNTEIELTPDDAHELIEEVYNKLLPHVMSYISSEIQHRFSGNINDIVSDHIDHANLARRIAGVNGFPQMVAQNAGREITTAVLEDERFNNRLFRRIGEATIGVTNEAVERVTAIIQAQASSDGDI